MRLIAAVLLLVPFNCLADERILSFHSDVRVFADSMIEVTETITVRVEGNAIRRGIYRDFPVEYKTSLGNTVEIAVTPVSVTRNGQSEPFHSRRSDRDIRTYFGSSDYFLRHGEHTYVFTYRANRMLGFFEEHDELYWNVTGFRWNFVIDKASATVSLDFDVPTDAIIVEGYTGHHGSKAQDYSRRLDEAGNVHFSANAKLIPSNGLTIVVGWPKGLVTEPNNLQRLTWLLSDNRDLMVVAIGFLVLLAYAIPIWTKHGKNPEVGPLVTRYLPPEGFSPASLRYISKNYYDNKVMTAAVVSLAVKGYIDIDTERYIKVLRRAVGDRKKEALGTGEQVLFDKLFPKGYHQLTLRLGNHSVLDAAREAHRESLEADYKNRYFKKNAKFNIPAIVIVLLTTIVALKIGNGPTQVVIGALVLLYATMSLFALIIGRPTLIGRKLLDEILGFKDYLQVAEKDELNLRNPPEKTPQLFEAYLPFALALGVDQKWSERFAAVLSTARDTVGSDYSPDWYNGDWSNTDLSDTTNAMVSDLSSSMGSSDSSPGSSSGFSDSSGGGGGGSSGGGGGGGGGGGW